MEQNINITFSDNIFLVGFRELYEIREVLKILACIDTKDNIELDEGIIISVFLIIPEEMLINHKSETSEEIDFIYELYDKLKKSAKFNFIFNFTLRLFLENIIPNLNKNTFCYIFGHGNPVIQVLGQQSEIIIGDDLLTGEKINYFFSHNANGIYLFFQYASCYNSLMFTKTNIHERILSIQDIECRKKRAEFSCEAVAQNHLFSQYNSINDIVNKSRGNNKEFIYKNLTMDDMLTFTLYDNRTAEDSGSADDDTENYEDYENYANDENDASDQNNESYGGKSIKGKRKRRKSKKKSKKKTRKTRNKSRKNKKTK